MRNRLRKLHHSKSKTTHQQQFRPASGDQPGYTRSRINYIAVHSTSTKPDTLLNAIDSLPYHYIISRAGKLISMKPVAPKDGTIEIALVGGLDKEGNRVDCRTERQNETLFNTLILLSEQYPEAKIVPADKLYVYSYSNPGFDLQAWIATYIPSFLRAVA